MSPKTFFSLLPVAAVAAISYSPPTDACTLVTCWPPTELLVTHATSIPQNAAGLLLVNKNNWKQDSIRIEKSSGEVVATTVDTESEGTNLVVAPTEGWEANTGYVISADRSCENAAPAHLQINVGTPAPLPQQLGTLASTPATRRSLALAAPGICSIEQTTVASDITLAPDPSAAQWAGLLEVETLVDGEKWAPSSSLGKLSPPGESWAGQWKDIVFTSCSEGAKDVSPMIGEGRHTVQFRARVLGTDVTIQSNTVEVTLSCKDAQPAPPLPQDPNPNDSDGPQGTPTTNNSSSSSGSNSGCSIGITDSPSKKAWVAMGLAAAGLASIYRRRKRMHSTGAKA